MLCEASSNLMNSTVRDKINIFISYFNVLYFFEIINIMISIYFIYNKFFSITLGIVLSLLLSFQIIMIYFRKNTNRKIQLFIMDIHLAYSIPAFIRMIIYDWHGQFVDVMFIIIRLLIVIFEPIFIYVLTDENIADSFNEGKTKKENKESLLAFKGQ